VWRERVIELSPDAKLGALADLVRLRDVQASLSWTMPDSLQGLLLECDGLTAWSAEYVWSAQRLLEMDREFQSNQAFGKLYLPFDGLMFFGDNGGGDQFAFVDRVGRPDVFVWEHEDDSRRWVANDLEDFLGRALRSGGSDWYA
jgi:hypothetical protein